MVRTKTTWSQRSMTSGVSPRSIYRRCESLPYGTTKPRICDTACETTKSPSSTTEDGIPDIDCSGTQESLVVIPFSSNEYSYIDRIPDTLESHLDPNFGGGKQRLRHGSHGQDYSTEERYRSSTTSSSQTPMPSQISCYKSPVNPTPSKAGRKLQAVPPNDSRDIVTKGKFKIRKNVRIRDYKVPKRRDPPCHPDAWSYQCRDGFNESEAYLGYPLPMSKRNYATPELPTGSTKNNLSNVPTQESIISEKFEQSPGPLLSEGPEPLLTVAAKSMAAAECDPDMKKEKISDDMLFKKWLEGEASQQNRPDSCVLDLEPPV